MHLLHPLRTESSSNPTTSISRSSLRFGALMQFRAIIINNVRRNCCALELSFARSTARLNMSSWRWMFASFKGNLLSEEMRFWERVLWRMFVWWFGICVAGGSVWAIGRCWVFRKFICLWVFVNENEMKVSILLCCA